MEIAELKSKINRMINDIQNEHLLRSLHDFLIIRTMGKSEQLWNTLTVEQKKEVLLSYHESEDKDNLVRADQIFKKEK